MNTFFKTLFRTILLASFAVWFGGFTFYVSFVVPIGNEVLGSAREQGFITQQVTHWLNIMCAISLATMAIETLASWRWTRRTRRVVFIISLVMIGASLGALVALHPVLDDLLVFEGRKVLERARFYQLHRAYLWISTIQWAFAWCWLFALVWNWQQESACKMGLGDTESISVS